MNNIKKFEQYINEDKNKDINNFKIFVDLDGVLANFQKRFIEIKKNIDNLDFDRYVDKYGIKKSWEIVDREGLKWWSHMEWMKDGKELWDYVLQYDPCILSSPSRSKHSVNGKTIWCKKELNIKQEEPTISPKLNRWDEDSMMIINTQKELFAKRFENSILIDDTKKKIEEWEKAGGIGILHKNTKDTIKKLNKIINDII